MVPLLSASTSLIMSCSSDSEGFWPSERMTVPSSLVVICPNHHFVSVKMIPIAGGLLCLVSSGTHHRHPCPVENNMVSCVSLGQTKFAIKIRQLTKRENASLYSETCSSVRESAYGRCDSAVSLSVPTNSTYLLPRSAGADFQTQTHARQKELNRAIAFIP